MKTTSHALNISITDIKLIFRDKSLLMLFFVPFLILAILRLAVPALVSWVPDLPDYYLLITGLTAVVASLFPGFIMAFIILDEKEQYLTDVFRVLPYSLNKLLLVRIFLSSFAGTLYSLFILLYSGLADFTTQQLIFASILNSVPAPLTALLVLSFSDNKIEGMVITKGINFVVMIPVAGFFIDGSWRFLLGIIPDFWTFEILFHPETNGFLNFASGIIISGILLLVAYRGFYSKMMRV